LILKQIFYLFSSLTIEDQRYKKKLNSIHHHKNQRNNYAEHNYKNDNWMINKDYSSSSHDNNENDLFQMSSEDYHKSAFNKGPALATGLSSPTYELLATKTDVDNGQNKLMNEQTYNNRLQNYNKLLDNRRYDSYGENDNDYNGNYPPAQQQQSYNSYMSPYYPSKGT